MNISLCFITILGGLTLGRPPLNIVQMLWCNLIMDVLGAIAIGTEPYATDPHHEQDLSDFNEIENLKKSGHLRRSLARIQTRT